MKNRIAVITCKHNMSQVIHGATKDRIAIVSRAGQYNTTTHRIYHLTGASGLRIYNLDALHAAESRITSEHGNKYLTIRYER